VVDHQLSDFVFKNGVKASLLMTAFTANGGRNIRFCCTLGELVLDEESGYIAVKPFGASQRAIDIKSLGGDANGGHGGGDYGIIEALYAALNGNNAAGVTTLEQSIESHLMALRAEQSRLAGGKTLAVHDDN
ncbi:MAG: gfo/Idh/MocA family oxidoreductase, partial [Clostridiales bacterium]|nr:gfo/Idh/MocA family oxidoreductase [Clostridiales bacterium]